MFRVAGVIAFMTCCLPASAQPSGHCKEVNFDNGTKLRLASDAIKSYQAVLEWPKERIFGVDVTFPDSSQLGSNCSLLALRLRPATQGPQPKCQMLANGNRSCALPIAEFGIAADAVMQASCNSELVEKVALSHVRQKALSDCNTR